MNFESEDEDRQSVTALVPISLIRLTVSVMNLQTRPEWLADKNDLNAAVEWGLNKFVYGKESSVGDDLPILNQNSLEHRTQDLRIITLLLEKDLITSVVSAMKTTKREDLRDDFNAVVSWCLRIYCKFGAVVFDENRRVIGHHVFDGNGNVMKAA
jgi:hypothetical protein